MTDDAQWLDALLPPQAQDAFRAALSLAATGGIASLRVSPSLMLTRSIGQFVRSALHVDLLALFAEGWSTASEIHGYCDAHQHPPGTTAILRLGAHQISRDLQPEVVVHYGGVRRFPIKGGIRIAGTFDGVEISIADRHITAVGSGHCSLTLEPELAGTPLHQPIVVRDWQLPGRHQFVPSIPIGRSSDREPEGGGRLSRERCS